MVAPVAGLSRRIRRSVMVKKSLRFLVVSSCPYSEAILCSLGPANNAKAVFDFKAYRLVVLPHVTSGIFLGADNVQQRVLGNVPHRFGLHSESIKAVGSVELVRLPATSIVPETSPEPSALADLTQKWWQCRRSAQWSCSMTGLCWLPEV